MAARRGDLRRLARCLMVAGGLAAAAPGDRAAAQDAALHDTRLPIEITADSLEVKQQERLAVFQGNVDAVQGDLRLTASEIRVHYRGGSGDAPEGAISRIDATGDVRFATPNETAQGDAGVYDVAAQVITLTGAVVLTRGDNVIRGEKLTLELATGRSRIESSTGVRGLFQPGESGSGG